MKSIKKLLCTFLTMLLLVSAITPVMADNNIKVRLGGELIKFDVQPQLINNRTMVPLRAIFEALGATVNWNGDTQTVTSTKDETTISLSINNPTMYVNGETVTLDSPACLVDGRTLVPVRAISEAFKLQVEWIDSTKTVRIKKETSLMSESSFYGVTWSYTYDDNGREIERKNVAYPEIYVNSEYDVDGNLIKENYSADGSSITYEYDESGNLIFEKNSDGSWTKNEYNDKGKITFSSNSRGTWVKYEYNEVGNLIKFSNSYDDITTYEYDENNNLIMEKSGETWTRYEYDKENKLISSTNSYSEYTQYEYDENGNLTYKYDNTGNYVKFIVVEI